MSRSLVTVVVPVYFNAESLPRLAERLQAIAASADFDVEAIFVDDGSGDESWGRIQEIAKGWPRARGLRLTRNFGSQMAIAAGLQRGARRSRGRPVGRPAGAARAAAGDGRGLAQGRDRGARRPAQPARGLDHAGRGRHVLPDAPLAGALADAVGRVRLFPDRTAGHRLSGREPRDPHVSAGTAGVGRLPDGARALRPARPRRRRIPLDPGQEGQVLHRRGDLVLVRAAALDVGPGRGDGLAGLRVRRVSGGLQDPARAAHPGLELADGRARVLLGSPALVAGRPRRIRLANARRGARAQGIPGSGKDAET